MTAADIAPSRFRLAIFRLAAVVTLSTRRRPEGETPSYLAFAPGQGPIETTATSIAWYLVATILLSARLIRFAGVAIARSPLIIPVAVVAIFVAYNVALIAIGGAIVLARRIGLSRGIDADGIQSACFHAVTIAASVDALRRSAIERWTGGAWLALVGLNIAAWLALAAIHAHVDRIEARFGAGHGASPLEE